jgi:ERCC4-type nuclease
VEADVDWGTVENLFQGLARTSEERPPRLPDDTPVIVDDREPPEMAQYLRNVLGKELVVVQRLEDEDYLISDVHISRKSQPDFVGSIQTGHIFDELARLLTSATKVKLIVEKGPSVPTGTRQMSWGQLYAQMAQALDSLNESIPVKITDGVSGTIDYLVRLRKRVIEGRFATIRRPVVVYGSPSQVVAMYAAIPGIGQTTAEEIAEKYPKPAELIAAIRKTYHFNEKKWKTKVAWREKRWDSGIRGVGEQRAESVAAFLLDGIEPGKKEE